MKQFPCETKILRILSFSNVTVSDCQDTQNHLGVIMKSHKKYHVQTAMQCTIIRLPG